MQFNKYTHTHTHTHTRKKKKLPHGQTSQNKPCGQCGRSEGWNAFILFLYIFINNSSIVFIYFPAPQASRAVNQAIGRVIRHRRDFGCVVLCDSRFAEERNRQSLSLWARPFVRECSGFGRVAADLTRFFKVLQWYHVVRGCAFNSCALTGGGRDARYRVLSCTYEHFGC